VQHEAGHAGAGVQIRGSVCTGWDDVNGGAVDPPYPDPPLCMTDHTPAYYALIHSPKYLSIQTPPPSSANQHPPGVYIFQKDIVRMETTVYTDVIDYAMPTMMAERALKELHNAALNKEFDKAIEFALEAAVQCRMASSALRGMAEEEIRRDRQVAVGS
jgi:hypothetical protein